MYVSRLTLSMTLYRICSSSHTKVFHNSFILFLACDAFKAYSVVLGTLIKSLVYFLFAVS